MQTLDIKGAQTSTRGFFKVKRRSEKDISMCLDTAGVPGAQSGTLLRGPKTTRNINPLLADYQYPGWSELTDKDNPFSLTKKETADAAAKKAIF